METNSGKINNLPRREFIKKAAITSTGIIILPRCYNLGGKGYISPSDKVNIGIVGTGGQSMYSIRELLKLEDVQLTAVADPARYWDLTNFFYKSKAGRSPIRKFIETHYSERIPNYKIAEYEDFREMLENEKALDAIVCATPDNTHAYISVSAMRAGKHVYCE